jgi:quinoprotein glucose dehydrogenase
MAAIAKRWVVWSRYPHSLNTTNAPVSNCGASVFWGLSDEGKRRIAVGKYATLIVTIACCTHLSGWAAEAQAPNTTWSTFGGTVTDANYSALTQINRSNVNKLQVAWTYDSGDKLGYVMAPIVVGRTLYGAAHNGSLVAIDATNGKEIWVHKFPPSPNARGAGVSTYRGLNYWQSTDGSDRRILVQVDGFIEAIDANTGKLVETFGDKGKVDLKTGMTRPSAESTMSSKSPGQVFENLLILGSATGEAYGSPPDDIRAFDVVTGSLAWVFHTIPHPGEYGYETWPKDAWTYTGGAGNWGSMSIDTKRGVVYIPTGTPKYEFWGGDRPGDTLFADSVLALDARSGKRLWHFQTVHHDVWEYELVPGPQLLTVRINGRPVDIVAQASKSGFLYVLNRDTGKPVWPIVERPVPKSDMPGEQLSPTQPFPTKPPPFARTTYTVKDVDTLILSPEERARWIELLSHAHFQGIFTPFSDKYFTLMMPGHSGGANLFSMSSDPETGTAYVISINAPALERFYTTPAEATKYIGANHAGFPREAEGDPVNGVQVTRRSPGGGESAYTAEGGVAAGGGGAASGLAQQGRTLYTQDCQQCHGAALDGGTGGAPSLLGVVGRLGEPGVRTTIHDGRGGLMPSFNSMSDSYLNNLVAFLRDPAAAPAPRVARSTAPPPYPPGAQVPPREYSAYSADPVVITPPYSTITAYDLNTGTIKWQIPDGEAVGVNPPGNNFGIIKDHGPKARLAVTAGGLLFQATIERKIRAYDKDTGKVLWTAPLPDGSEGSPAVYEVDGRQYVAVCIRGAYLAFALPEGSK